MDVQQVLEGLEAWRLSVLTSLFVMATLILMAAEHSLKDRTILVTGGAVRIGRSIVLALANAGADIVVHARRSRAEADALVALLRQQNRRAWRVTGDLAAPAGPADVFSAAIHAAGRLDGLVNNASIFARKPLAQCTQADFDAAWQINALAPMLLTRLLAEHVAQRSGKSSVPVAGVVNLLDQRIAHASVGCMPYLVSKQALAAFTQSAAAELAPGLTVNAVAPGAVLLPVGSEGREPAGVAPLGRHATPEQVAAAVVFLLANPAITGQILYVDGGQHLGGAQ